MTIVCDNSVLLSSLQWPQNRQQDHDCDEHDDRQRHADLQVVDKAVTAGTHDQDVGRVRDRARKAGGCCHGDGHHGRVRVQAHVCIADRTMGDIRTTSAAVGIIIVAIAVST